MIVSCLACSARNRAAHPGLGLEIVYKSVGGPIPMCHTIPA